MILATLVIAWLFAGQDPISFYPAVNDWGTAFLIVVCLQLLFIADLSSKS